MRTYDDKFFESITIVNDKMFRDVFGKDRELARKLLSTVLERPVGRVEYLSHAHEMRSDLGARSTWFDVFLKTDSGEIGNVEMQGYVEKALGLRVRAHVSAMNRDAWSAGDSFSQLGRATSVFLCTYDPVGADLKKYVIHRHFEEPEACLLDGEELVMLNAVGTGGIVSERLELFLRYVAGYHDKETMANEFVRAVEKRVRELRQSAEWKEGFVTLQEILDRERAAGIEQGMAQGITQTAAKLVLKGVMSVDEAAAFAGLSRDALASLLASDASDQAG